MTEASKIEEQPIDEVEASMPEEHHITTTEALKIEEQPKD